MTNYTGKLTDQKKTEALGRIALLRIIAEVIDVKLTAELKELVERPEPEQRIYADSFYTTDDKELLQSVIALDGLRKDLGDEDTTFKRIHKMLADHVRRLIGINSVISLAVDSKDETVLVFEYKGIIATDSDFYKAGYDKELGNCYLIV
jgi:hypothetical protein